MPCRPSSSRSATSASSSANPNEKQKLQRDVSNIMLEWTRRGLDLKKMRGEIAELEGKAAPGDATDTNDTRPPRVAAIPPVTAKPDPNASASRFETTDNVRLEGDEIRSFKAPSPDACRNPCDAEPGCVAYQHDRKFPRSWASAICSQPSAHATRI